MTGVLIEDGRAVGVAWRKDGAPVHRPGRAARWCWRPARWRRRKLLELSGLGDGERLAALGLPVRRHLPGVGENLQDHLQIRPTYKVTGVPTMNAHLRLARGAGR